MKKPYTIPIIKTDNPDKWFISYTYAVPAPLLKYKDLYPRKIKRFKVYKGINSVTGDERIKLANEIRDTYELALKTGVLNPFAAVLDAMHMGFEINKKKAKEQVLTESERRRLMPFKEVMDLYIAAKKKTNLEPKTIAAYQTAVDWMVKGYEDTPISEITFVMVSDNLDKYAAERAKINGKPITNHSLNNQFGLANGGMIWASIQDYVIKNPLEGKYVTLKTSKSIHKWYDRETAIRVKEALKSVPWLRHVCQFTYWIMIRSKKELQHIKIGDIDFDLEQVMFRKEWTKNDSDQNRDYTPEFAAVLEEMNLRNLPKDWYIFGTGGLPGPIQCGANYFGSKWAKLRTTLGLSSDYTIYGWKHTRIVHMMMLKIDSYEISHQARHGDSKTTEEYKQDYDIRLTKIYKIEDLTF